MDFGLLIAAFALGYSLGVKASHRSRRKARAASVNQLLRPE